MLFNSLTFLVFLIILLPLFYLGNRTYKKSLLLVSSYVFYGFWNWRFLFLIALSTVIDYLVGRGLGRVSARVKRKWLLTLSVVSNLGILGFFKYYNFFAQSLVELLASLGVTLSYTSLNIVLPVGISFYTFQTMSYSIDVYRGQFKPTRNFLDFAIYVSFFPQLVAGPIERASRLLPQVEKFNGIAKTGIKAGMVLMLTGYVKKVLISDNIAPLVDRYFANYMELDAIYLVAGIILFSFQVYFDFSGYSDIARGVARLFGIDLMVNFNQPYFSWNFAEFWKRWHISLSSWLRDYLFLPVAFAVNRRIKTPLLLNIKAESWSYAAGVTVTMFLGGLWHGASWHFVFWGILHGFYLTLYKLFGFGKLPRKKTPSRNLKLILNAIVVYCLVALAWLPFRAPDPDTAWRYFTRMFSSGGGMDYGIAGLIVFLFLVMFLLDFPAYKYNDHLFLLKLPDWLVTVILLAGALTVTFTLIVHQQTIRPFIYFQF